MSIKRVATFTDGRNPVALLVETEGARIKIDHSEKGAFVGADDAATEEALKAEMVRRAPTGDKADLEKIWIHINQLAGRRQGELVIATGVTPPQYWPEEEDPDTGEPK